METPFHALMANETREERFERLLEFHLKAPKERKWTASG
jgi:hypothetical protein